MDKVREWLESIGLGQYGDAFHEDGWDDMDTVSSMTETDIKSIVKKSGHARKIYLSLKNQIRDQQAPDLGESSINLSHLEIAEIQQSDLIVQRDSAQKHITHSRTSSSKVDVHDQTIGLAEESNSDRFGTTRNTEKKRCLQLVESDSESSDDEKSLNLCVPKSDSVVINNQAVVAQTDVKRMTASSTIVQHSKNVTIAETVQLMNANTVSETSNFQTQIDSCLKLCKKKEKLFVKTRAFTEAVDILDDRNWVVIIGNPGDGKTTIAHKLLLDHDRKDYSPVIATSQHDWKKLVVGKGKHGEKQIVLIDDMFGISNFNDTRVNEWLYLLELMVDVVTERDDSLKVVCTSRKSVFNQVVNKLVKYKEFGKLATVDLSVSPHSLSFQEKQKILETYFKHYDIYENYVKYHTQIASIDFNYGFPHCVEIFCTNSLIRKQGISFFRYPIKFVQNEIEDYHKNDPKKLCALLLVLLSRSNKVCLADLDCGSDALTTCLKLSGLSSNNVYTLYGAFISLQDVYLIQEGDIYTFKHDSFREIIAIHFAKYFPTYAIKLLDLDFLINRTTLTKSGKANIHLIVELPLSNSEHLAERLTNELMNGNSSLVFVHDCWQNPSFQDSWFQYVSIKTTSKRTLLSQCLEQKYAFNVGLLAYLALRKFERLLEILLRNILSNRELCADKVLLEAQASDALVCSTLKCLSSNILELLLDSGADVDGKLRNVPKECLLFEFWFEVPPCGITPLVIATHLGSVDNVTVLIKHGASIFETGYRHDSIFSLAVGRNAVKVLEALLQHLAQRGNYLVAKGKDCMKLNVVQHFVEINYESFISARLKRIPASEDIEKVILSYESGERDVCLPSELQNIHDWKNGLTYLIRDTNSDVTLRRYEVKEQCIAIEASLHTMVTTCRYLLEPGSCKILPSQIMPSDCNESDINGNIPLFYALVSSRNIDSQFIDALWHNSDVNWKNRYGWNCFHFLALSQPHENFDGYIVKLKQAGVNINERDSQGRPPIIFSSTVETLEIFQKHGARLDLKDYNGADIMMLMIKGTTQDIIEKVSFLLENGVGANRTDSENRTVLHYLVYSEHYFETQKAVLDLLIKYGCEACKDSGVLKSVICHLLQNPGCNPDLFKLLVSFQKNISKSDIDYFFTTISDSPMSSNKKVRCLTIMGELCPIECKREQFDALFRLVNVPCNLVKKIFGCLSISQSHLDELIFLTLEYDIYDSIKYSILKLLLARLSFDAVKFELGLDQKKWFRLILNPRCFNLLRRRGLCIKSLSLADIPFEEIVSRPKLLKALKFHAVQLLDLKSIIGIKHLSILVNKMAKTVSLKVLSALLKQSEGLDFTVSDENGNTLLHNVLGRHGRVDTSIIDFICSSSTEINQKNHEGDTPLFIACKVKRPYLSVVGCLIKNGGNVGYISSEGLTPLHLLMGKIGRQYISDTEQVGNFYSDYVVQMVDELNITDNCGRTPLMYLIMNIRRGKGLMVELLYLLENSRPFDKIDNGGNSLLHYIAASHLPDGYKASLSRVLLEKGISHVTKNCKGRYAIDMALFSDTPSLKLCRDTSDLFPTETVVQCLFNNVKFASSERKVKILLEQFKKTTCSVNWKDDTGVTFLSLACRHLKTDLIEHLLSIGSNPNIPDSRGHTAIFSVLFTDKALDISFRFCDFFGLNKQEELDFHTRNMWPRSVPTISIYRRLEKAFRLQEKLEKFSHHNDLIAEINNLLEILQLLLYHGADPNQIDIYGKSPLHYCAEAPLLDTFICAFMEILISHGANVNAEDFEGRTPIMLCAAYGRTKYRRMNILIKAKANLFCKDYSGKDTLDYAKQSFLKTWIVLKASERNDK